MICNSKLNKTMHPNNYGNTPPKPGFLPAKMLLIMRLTAVLLLAAAMHVSAAGLTQKVTIAKKNASLEQIFEILQQQSGYSFMFNSHTLANAKKVDIQVNNATVEEVLKLCFSNQAFTYVVKDKVIIVTPKEDDGAGAFNAPPPPPQHVTGTVKDEAGKPVEGAAVTIAKTTIGVLTDKQGNFDIAVPTAGGYVLEVSFIGYKTVSKPVTVGGAGLTGVAITLQAATTGLADVVVVGYGVQSKKDVTGTISSVKGDDIKNLPVSNVATALQGRAAGVDIISGDGAPGSTPSIRIRGTGTINSADPLVVIDGVPSGGLNDVNPNDIASVEILKDASSSAIYGTRAANGVVLVTTKKGNYGEQLKTSFNYYTGQNKPIKYLDMLTAPDLAMLKKESYTNDGLNVPTIWNNPYYSTQRTDWQRALMGKGTVQNADIAVRGGNSTSTYSVSGNFYDDKGMIPNSYFKRYSFRINSEHKLGKRIVVGENVMYANTDGTSPDTRSTQAGLVWSAIRFNPAIPVFNADGTWGTSQADNQLGDINNPVATASEKDAYNKNDRLLANGYAELEIIKGLKLHANYGYDQSTGDNYSFNIAMPTQTRGPSISSLGRSFSKSYSFLEEYYLSFNRQVAPGHNLGVTAGYSSQIFKGNYFSASRSGFSDTSIDQRVLNLGSSQGNGGGNYNAAGLQSAFVRANYSFKNRYLLTATMRADGSSKFEKGKRWGYFPAFSAGWRISDESFYDGRIKDVVNTLKITGGWGQLGNQNIGDFQYLSGIGYGGGFGYSTGTGTVYQNGSAITNLANPNVTWERAVMTNISLEFALLKNKVYGTVTYFNKNTSDMLVPYQLVETFGAQTNLPDDGGNITLPNQNIGQLNNRGVEIELNYQGKLGKLNYTLGANGSFLSNKVTKLYGKSTYLAGSQYGRENVDISRTYEGQPIASFFGFKTAGLYQTQADIDKDANVANDGNKDNIKPGDVRFVDINGDGVINDQDRVNLGNPNPTFVFGFHGYLTYKGFDFSFNFAGATGFKLYNADRLAGLDATQVFNWYADQKNRWHGAGTSNSIPRLSNANLNNNYRSSDLWVQNGAYLSLKSISVGYTFTKIHISDVVLPDIRLYASSYNLFVLTKYSGYTPELGYTSGNLQRGVDVAQYPQARNLTIGASVNF